MPTPQIAAHVGSLRSGNPCAGVFGSRARIRHPAISASFIEKEVPGDNNMEQMKSGIRFWSICAIVTFVVIAAAGVRWSLDHPYGAHWDEAQNLNEVAIDTSRLQAGMLFKVAGRILKSWGRPPAYRVLAVPVLALFGFHTATARLVTVACFGLSAWFIYLAVRRVANGAAGAFAVLVFCLSPQVVSASIWFSSEGPLYLATAAMLYYLFSIWTDTSKRTSNWIGLGLAVGLGLLSKASFVLIGIPVVVFAAIADRWRPFGTPTFSCLRRAAVVTLLVAGPWWVLNLKASSSYVAYSRDFTRHSLGTTSAATLVRWFGSVVQSLLGYGLSVLIVLVLIGFIRYVVVRRQWTLGTLQSLAIGACACAGVPIVLAQMSGTNHLLRHISPAVIPLAIVVGIVADHIGVNRSKSAVAACSVCFVAQLLMILSPVFAPNTHLVDSGIVNGTLPWRILVRDDQWDWNSVKNLSDSCHVEYPKISYIGDSRAFNQPQIEYPWAVKGQSTDVEWLWRSEDGPPNWQTVMSAAGQSDIVITAPNYVGAVSNGENLDNQHNAEFADRLSQDPNFEDPIRLEMGRLDPVEVLFFVNRSLACQPQVEGLAIH
jgi:4-amino-4-deoxy-L-arabinose transferase-like glycosyltransferase